MTILARLLESIFPFLFSALKRAWDQLTTDQQTALKNAGIIGQYLKNNLTALGDDLVQAIVNATGLPKASVEQAFTALAVQFGANPDVSSNVNQSVAYLQGKLSAAQSTVEWNGLLSTILNAAAIILSGGALDWVHIALGLGEWVYQQFVKGVPVQPVSVNMTTVAPVNGNEAPNA